MYKLINVPCSTQRTTHVVWTRTTARANKKNHSKNSLSHEKNTRKPYIENLCLSRILDFHSRGFGGLEGEASEILNLFLKKDGGAANFPLICKNDFPIVDESVQLNFFLYDLDCVDSAMIGAFARKKLETFQHCSIITLQELPTLWNQNQCSF